MSPPIGYREKRDKIRNSRDMRTRAPKTGMKSIPWRSRVSTDDETGTVSMRMGGNRRPKPSMPVLPPFKEIP